jgi:hypothetical protein
MYILHDNIEPANLYITKHSSTTSQKKRVVSDSFAICHANEPVNLTWNSRIHNKFTNTRIIQIFCTNDKNYRLLERACNSVFKFKEFSFYISGTTGNPFRE